MVPRKFISSFVVASCYGKGLFYLILLQLVVKRRELVAYSNPIEQNDNGGKEGVTKTERLVANSN